MYKRILLAYDGSESGQKALLDSLDIAQWSNAELHLVAVMPRLATTYAGLEGGLYINESEEEEKHHFRAILDDGLQRLSASGYPARGEVVVGEPVSEISTYAKKIGADLIVIGHKHLDSWAARWWRGSTSPALIEHAPCSVLVSITH
jgi:nucleotide-binding universal stress UspA family protein